jgi:hypothetical protein
MLQSQQTNTSNRKSKASYWLSKMVQCVPGGHQIPISEAYWCGECGWYICYKDLKKGTFTTAIHCPKGHDVTRAT